MYISGMVRVVPAVPCQLRLEVLRVGSCRVGSSCVARVACWRLLVALRVESCRVGLHGPSVFLSSFLSLSLCLCIHINILYTFL